MEPNGTGAPVVTDNTAKSRYEMHVGDHLAGFVNYRLQGEVINLIHTEVDPKFQGAGLAGHLAKSTLDDARARHLTVQPTCPYIRSWIGRHPDYADLVAQRGTGKAPTEGGAG
jgi:predicted GNAT family acetyltransferase